MTDSEHWARYYEVTADRPAWSTTRVAIERFAAEDAGAAPAEPRLAVDLGCGAGRDTRALLDAGWRVLAVDREPRAIEVVESLTPSARRPMLATLVANLATVEIPLAQLVNANISLPFLEAGAYWRTWSRALAAVPVGGRVAAMLFAERDSSAEDPAMTCPPVATIRATLGCFEVEHWVEREEDGRTALGDPHHIHVVELVARRAREGG